MVCWTFVPHAAELSYKGMYEALHVSPGCLMLQVCAKAFVDSFAFLSDKGSAREVIINPKYGPVRQLRRRAM